MLPASKYRLSAFSEIDSEILPLLTVLVAIGKSAQMAQISLAVFVCILNGMLPCRHQSLDAHAQHQVHTSHTSSQTSIPPRFMTAMQLQKSFDIHKMDMMMFRILPNSLFCHPCAATLTQEP